MAYFLRQEKKKNRTYLQMYENFWDKQKKQPRTRHIETFGYVDELISDEMPDPVTHFQAYVKEREAERLASQAEETRPRVCRPFPFEYTALRTKCERRHGYPCLPHALSVQRL